MNIHGRRGFTLIELLVVIAIIGILSAVVLVSTGSLRNKAKDDSIKSNLKTVATQAAVYVNTSFNYGPSSQTAVSIAVGDAACAIASSVEADRNVTNALKAADAAAGGTGSPTSKVMCAVSAGWTSWAIYAPLYNPPSGATGYCIDSTGAARYSNAPAANTYACP